MSNQIPHQDLTYGIIGAAMEVHADLGPGYKEEIYQKALEIELRNRKIKFEPQRSIEIKFKGEMVGWQILDFFVDDKVVVEIRALSKLDTDHEAQIISYLKATNSEIGLLINFGTKRLEYKRIFPPRKIKEWSKGSTDLTVNGWNG
jgi:GxxExxY protein